MRWVVALVLVLMLGVPVSPALAVCDLSQVVGYTLVFGKTVESYIEDSKRVPGFVVVQFGDRFHRQFVELDLGQRQRRIAANHQAGGGIDGEAIEIRIDQDVDPFFGFLQQAVPDRLDVLGSDRLSAEDAATGIAPSAGAQR